MSHPESRAMRTMVIGAAVAIVVVGYRVGQWMGVW